MNNSSKLWLLYLGRLEKEKGFWLILELIQSYQWSDLPFEIYIFWSWSYENQVLELQNKYKQVHFFGRKTLEEIQRYLPNIDYCLMPSLCLETFGLSALNVLQWGIPVAWFQKWGLRPFILDDYAINKAAWKQEIEQLKNLINHLIQEKKHQNSDFYNALANICKSIAQKYTREKWFEQFQSMVFDFKCRKIVLVSDFINKIGGIETYIHDVKAILESKGYQVQLRWSQCPSGFWGKVKKLWGLWLAMLNLYEAIRFYFFIQKENPDLIWYNNMIRWNWRMPLALTKFYKAKKWMMYHDLGYFHPFPSKVYEESQVKPLNRRNFLKMANSKNIFLLLLVMYKYLSLKLLYRQLSKSIDRNLVPSPFMEKFLHNLWSYKLKSITTFAHFWQNQQK